MSSAALFLPLCYHLSPVRPLHLTQLDAGTWQNVYFFSTNCLRGELIPHLVSQQHVTPFPGTYVLQISLSFSFSHLGPCQLKQPSSRVTRSSSRPSPHHLTFPPFVCLLLSPSISLLGPPGQGCLPSSIGQLLLIQLVT